MNQSKMIVVVGIVTNKQNEILIAQRTANQSQAGYWEFPGGKVEVDETLEQALTRELHEEVHIKPLAMSSLKTIEYDHGDRPVQLNFFRVEKFSGTAHGAEQQEIKWIKSSELSNYQFPEANQPIIELLMGESSCKNF
ncbi:MAG: 8-oxo-dGTP diphosphatase MutT [Gammaproteobacteria bacterium]|nr:8-oxo-dGTP diphosphatase MutT [Gammaproteobacteria bacterium]